MHDPNIPCWSDLLGITSEQAAELFQGRNTLADLWRIAAEITGGAVVAPPGVEAL